VRIDKIAEGFDEYVERELDIAPAIERALASGKPTVIHVPIDPMANAWGHRTMSSSSPGTPISRQGMGGMFIRFIQAVCESWSYLRPFL
jgi:hypothetical protein